ncbi:hypothetical protein JAAARDRAFT_137934 [Jaapia argillacea MUCL 33604]|uniref:Reverse transcriptase zinc-binding domain-containing protein n=1 Tax=Jaapia argillacea MUCL 33604 TaxID=933084 RepID=A0A067PDM0_9AGAM|nr:hypothetical protein JAAARDRAFT_137934 [Jaapia argillacea MUCL 33604]
MLNLTVPPSFNLQGAKLSAITQAIAYKGIWERARQTTWPKASISLERTRLALKDANGNLDTDQMIWMGSQSSDIQQKISQYLFLAMHQTQIIGSFWRNIPNFKERAVCRACGDIDESMEHILLECSAMEGPLIWNLVRSLWPTSWGDWPHLSIGTILGWGRYEPGPYPQGLIPPPPILVSESAHLIWAFWCQRVIQGAELMPTNVTKRWENAINKRLMIDRIIAARQRRKKGKDVPDSMQKTWTGTLANEADLPENWVTALEVLVSISPPRVPQLG